MIPMMIRTADHDPTAGSYARLLPLALHQGLKNRHVAMMRYVLAFSHLYKLHHSPLSA